MPQSYQIGDHRVDVTDQSVIATLAIQRGPGASGASSDRWPLGFLRGVYGFRGTWIGDRIVFRPDLADRVVDLFRTHFGMTSDGAGLDPLPASPQPIRVPIARVARRSLVFENASELERLRASLPTLEHRVTILRQRLAGAERVVAGVRARIDALDQVGLPVAGPDPVSSDPA